MIEIKNYFFVKFIDGTEFRMDYKNISTCENEEIKFTETKKEILISFIQLNCKNVLVFQKRNITHYGYRTT